VFVFFAALISSSKEAIMARIDWVEDDQATGKAAEVYTRWKAANNGRAIPDILKCFSSRPDVLEKIEELSKVLHFSDGHLNRRTKEKIASFVSALNKCRY
jgi:hypothetical protein